MSKKFYWLSLLFLSICGQAQTVETWFSNKTNWEASITTTPQHCLYSNDADTENGKYSAVPTFGLAHHLSLSRRYTEGWGWAVELAFSEQGQTYEPNISLANDISVFDRRFYFLKLPLLAKKSFRVSKNIYYDIQLGAQLSYLMQARYFKDGNVVILPQYNGDNTTAMYQPLNVDAIAKTGFTFWANEHLGVVLHLRSDYSIFNPDNLGDETWKQPFSTINTTDTPAINRPVSNLASVGLSLGISYRW